MIMLVSTSGQVQPLAPVVRPAEQSGPVDEGGSVSPPPISPDRVSISEAGKSRLAQEREYIEKARNNQAQGLMALGNRAYESRLSSISNVELRSAFARGDTFFAAQPLDSKAEALASYAAVARAG